MRYSCIVERWKKWSNWHGTSRGLSPLAGINRAATAHQNGRRMPDWRRCDLFDIQLCLEEHYTRCLTWSFFQRADRTINRWFKFHFSKQLKHSAIPFQKSILNCYSFPLTEISRNHQLPISTITPEQDVCCKIPINTVSVPNHTSCSCPQSSPSLERFHLSKFDSRV
jgi:hypothetical protein